MSVFLRSGITCSTFFKLCRCWSPRLEVYVLRYSVFSSAMYAEALRDSWPRPKVAKQTQSSHVRVTWGPLKKIRMAFGRSQIRSGRAYCLTCIAHGPKFPTTRCNRWAVSPADFVVEPHPRHRPRLLISSSTMKLDFKQFPEPLSIFA